jgi:hypothetical protein
MLISETHFTDKSFLKIPDYNLYHTNHPDNTAHVGSAVLITNSIDHYQLNGYKKNYLQATSVRVKTLPYDITVSAVYCPPCHNVKREQFNDFFQNLGQNL